MAGKAGATSCGAEEAAKMGAESGGGWKDRIWQRCGVPSRRHANNRSEAGSAPESRITPKRCRSAGSKTLVSLVGRGDLLGVSLLLLLIASGVWGFDDFGEDPIVPCQSLGLRVTEIQLDAPVADMLWLPGKVVFVITTKRTLYRSSDDGRTFKSVMGMLEDSQVQELEIENGVEAMHVSDADTSRVFFKGGGSMHWVTYNGGKSYHARRTGFTFYTMKMHKTDADCILASRLNDRCTGKTQEGYCYMSLYVTTDFGTTWREAVQYVQMFDWGPHDRTVVYSAFEDDAKTHQFFRQASDLNIYRSSNMLQSKDDSRLVVRHGVGFKVAKSGVYVAVKGEESSMQLFVSRDDAQSFLPAVFPSQLQETRYTILDENDGTVFISVEHKQNTNGVDDVQGAASASMLSMGDLYASVADGEVLFKDDFESGLTRWRGKGARSIPSHSRIVQDPLCKEAEGCRGKVLKMDDCAVGGDAFSFQSFTCSTTRPCKISYWVLGTAWQGFSEGFPGLHIWSAAGNDNERGVHVRTPSTRDRWTRVEYVFPRKHSEFTWEEHKEAVAGSHISRVRVMLEAHSMSCNETYFDDIRVTRAKTEDYVVALRDQTRDMMGHVDLHVVHGINGILSANTKSSEGEVKTVYSVDNGNEWRPLLPPDDASHSCSYRSEGYAPGWYTSDGKVCSLHLHLGHKIKGVPGNWEFRAHKEVDRRFGAFLTNRHAIGLVVGVGNVGSQLVDRMDEVSTYVSRDAGETWLLARKGSHAYDVADQGTLLLLSRNDRATNEVTLSADGGETFRTCSLQLEHDMEVTDVIADPNATSSNFLIHGTVPGKSQAVFVSVDMSMLFPRRCTDMELAGDDGSEFELWSPHGNSRGCEMGRKESFVRRKASARCYVGSATALEKLVHDCPCTESDYECDYCYERVGEAKAAQMNSSATACSWACGGEKPADPPKDCKGTYLRSRGYRKIEGNTCQGGLDLSPQRLMCPGTNYFQQKYGNAANNGGGGGWSLGGVLGGLVVVGALAGGVGSLVSYLKTATRRNGGGIEGALTGVMTSLSTLTQRRGGGGGYAQLSTTDNDDFSFADQLLSEDYEEDQ